MVNPGAIAQQAQDPASPANPAHPNVSVPAQLALSFRVLWFGGGWRGGVGGLGGGWVLLGKGV